MALPRAPRGSSVRAAQPSRGLSTRPIGRYEGDRMEHLFELRVSVPELVVRGTAVYWFLFLLFRFVLRRDVGQLGVADVLLLVLVADASQNAMSGSYTTITEGFVLVATIAG